MGIPEICDDFDYNPCKSLGCLYAPDAPGNVIKCAGCVDACPADIPEICAPGGMCIEKKCPPYYSPYYSDDVSYKDCPTATFQSCAATCAPYKDCICSHFTVCEKCKTPPQVSRGGCMLPEMPTVCDSGRGRTRVREGVHGAVRTIQAVRTDLHVRSTVPTAVPTAVPPSEGARVRSASL